MHPPHPLPQLAANGRGLPYKPFEPLNPHDPSHLYWLWLAELKGLSPRVKLDLLRHFTTPQALWSTNGLDLPSLSQSHNPGLGPPTPAQWKKLKDLDPASRLMERNASLGIKLWTLNPGAYRASKELADQWVEPRQSEDIFFVVYVLGEPVTGPSAAVIGTRQASGDGYHATELVCRDLIQRGFCINSGLALGIDSFAHRFALAEGGQSQGFVAHGLDRCYPSAHYGLMRSLTEHGAVISPFPLGTEPYKVNFLRRNALMSLWSEEVILIEAGLQSGALNTAEHAIRQGRRLWAVPGRPGSKACAGNQKLLSQGLAEAYPVALGPGVETPILTLLRDTPMSIGALADVMRVPLASLEQELLEYERSLLVAYLPDGRWHYRGW
ncbi:DNA-processing protein DprA [Acidaminobacter hydrogenoformans]|uniref:DNA processing protein n=1 Tax=Acidaminobacter hydrogenoformans DSM 2784 TaxID=1120920 RepID=A0A1G5S656_9FIRM|nr:DNA-processing protein DprA [Acidaminobacter hydrogenoformans]SCZ81813.1 DNA processing protein [Acidaminobacter hydrogenoformans DSM 2784]